MARRAPLLAALVALASCDPATGADAGATDARVGPPDASCMQDLALAPPDGTVERALAAPCLVRLSARAPVVVDVAASAGTVDGAAALGPLVVDDAGRTIRTSAPATLRVRVLGPLPEALAIERSLTWTDDALLDGPALGLARVLGAVDGAPGPLLDAWFRRFGTTAHSERLGPQRILEEQIAAQGADPAAWDLDAFPFRATGVHHRVDLTDGSHCGELRVSYASTHPLHAPFHLIFLFRVDPGPLDRRADGVVHCAGVALALARLSALDEAAFRAEAAAILDARVTRDAFLAAETLEFIISPWEWRQWFLDPDGRLDNRPLFQTVDTPRVNTPGPDRDAFLAFVEAEADALAARRAAIPERFRSPSARVNDGVPWIPLDLTGLDPAIEARLPSLRPQIELVGCPACHATDADFVQTRPDRTFSPFYTKELDARRAWMGALLRGEAAAPPHGPLQADPVLPP